MKSGKVAICISGQVRTGLEAVVCFKKFFSLFENYDVFFHTWNDTDSQKINKKLFRAYNPTDYIIQRSLPDMGSFGSMLYSIMMANELKKRYEIENNFRYDIVIKTRFDLVFNPVSYFPKDTIGPRTIYCSSGNFGLTNTDFENHGINDVIFWGDSQSMDIATNTYMYYKHVALEKRKLIVRGMKFDPNDIYFSAGTLIYKTCVEHNIALHRFVLDQTFRNIGETPWRSDIAELDPFNDYQKIRERYQKNA